MTPEIGYQIYLICKKLKEREAWDSPTRTNFLEVLTSCGPPVDPQKIRGYALLMAHLQLIGTSVDFDTSHTDLLNEASTNRETDLSDLAVYLLEAGREFVDYWHSRFPFDCTDSGQTTKIQDH